MFIALPNQDRKPKFRTGVNHMQVTISKSRLRCQIPIRNLQRPPKPTRPEVSKLTPENTRNSQVAKPSPAELKFKKLAYPEPEISTVNIISDFFLKLLGGIPGMFAS